MTPKPDPLEVSMLNPPPIAKVIKELRNIRISIYLTEAEKREYEQLKGENITWSQFGRKLMKEELKGDGKYRITPNIEAFAAEVHKIFRGLTLTSIPKGDIEDDSEYTEARKKAKRDDLIKAVAQTDDHKGFMDVCVPELKVKFKKVKGMDNWNERYTEMGLKKKGTLEVGEKSDLELEIIMQSLEVVNK